MARWVVKAAKWLFKNKKTRKTVFKYGKMLVKSKMAGKLIEKFIGKNDNSLKNNKEYKAQKKEYTKLQKQVAALEKQLRAKENDMEAMQTTTFTLGRRVVEMERLYAEMQAQLAQLQQQQQLAMAAAQHTR